MTTHAIQRVTIDLPAELGTSEVEALKLSLLEALDADRAVSLSAAAVRRVGISALQLFAALWLERASEHVRPAWHEPSAALIEAATNVGLSELLGLSGV